MKQRVKFTFPAQMVPKPIIYMLGRDFSVVTNIRRADVQDKQGWVVLELEGEQQAIQRGLDWVRSEGVRVDPVSGDIVEG